MLICPLLIALKEGADFLRGIAAISAGIWFEQIHVNICTCRIPD